MLVKDLIAALSAYPEDTIVCVNGYEGGVTEIKPNSISLTHVKLQANTAWYYGEHEEEAREGKADATVLLISR